MDGRTEAGVVRLPPPARERFYDSRGYGRPRGEGLDLARVEAAHLLYRGDIEAVDGLGFRAFLATQSGLVVRFLVYKDLRDRGFYLAPAARRGAGDDVDFVVFPRGRGPWDDEVAHRVRVVGERERVEAATLGGAVLAVVDEESEMTYLDTTDRSVEGTTDHPLPESVAATLLDDRAVCWDPPATLHERSFYGQPLDRDGDALQLSLVEAAYLAAEGVVALADGDGRDGDGPGTESRPDADEGTASTDAARIRERGRRVEGDRFDRRLAAYRALREAGVVPKTGFKFGADFRTYAAVESVDDLGHSELLVRVLPPDHAFAPRDLSLDVRLAHGVRKTVVFGLVGDDVEWVGVERLTP